MEADTRLASLQLILTQTHTETLAYLPLFLPVFKDNYILLLCDRVVKIISNFYLT